MTNIGRRQQHFSIWIRPVRDQDKHFVLRMAIGELDAVFDPCGFLNRASDDGETAMGHDRMAAENGTHVDHFDVRTPPRRLEGGREP